MVYPTCSDEVLIDLITQRDPDAFAALYDRYAAPVYELILRIVRDATESEVLLEETFWRIWAYPRDVSCSGSLMVWLWRRAHEQSVCAVRCQRALTGTDPVLSSVDHQQKRLG